MKVPELHACPICKGKVQYYEGYYYEGGWIYPKIICRTQYCGLVYQPVVYPDKGEIFEQWNAQG